MQKTMQGCPVARSFLIYFTTKKMATFIKDRDALKKIVEGDAYMYWRLYSGMQATGDMVGEQQDNITPKQSWEVLNDRLDDVIGVVTITMSKHKKETGDNGKTTLKFHIKTGSEPVAGQTASNNGIGNLGLPSIWEVIQENQKLKMEALEAKITGNGGGMSLEEMALWKEAIGIGKSILGLNPGTTTTPVAGQEPAATPGPADADKGKRTMEALRKLAAKDPAIVDKLEKLAELAEEKPDTYTQAGDLLMNQ